ncbi:hypothetical protein AaE_001853 [Aphanomyces astaci]|uniref:Uncharacterized protein n=1 Tax=Aphanomyces astaci TaxID=112090 RepID=A0A6A5ABG3_APHAT|nr:hypothetical protein AaE_001853 [Aphanomyces astaci]
MRKVHEPPSPRRRHGTLAERLDAQRARYLALKRRAVEHGDDGMPQSLPRRLPSKEPLPTCHLRLELPGDVQDYLRSIGLHFDAISTDESLGRAVSALAVRLYKTDLALQHALEETSLPHTPHAF